MRLFSIRDWSFLLLLTAAGILISGYHYGIEDQAIWLAGVKKTLHPAMYPYDSEFFLSQTSLSQFSHLIAFGVRWTKLPLEWIVFIVHALSIFLLLGGCLALSRKCFCEPHAQWAAVTMVAVLLSLSVAGTALLLVGQYLHPRTLATVALMFGLLAVLEKRLTALCWVALAIVLHPTMGLFGAMHLAVQAWPSPKRGLSLRPAYAALLLPFLNPLFFSDAWREAMSGRRYVFPERWTWYELLGALAPPLILLCFARIGRSQNASLLEHVSRRLALSCALGVAAGVLISLIPAFEPLLGIETLRTLHFVYLIMFFLGAGILAQRVLKDRPLRWLLLFLPLSLGLFWAQRAEFPDSPQVEWPGRAQKGAWLDAFDWIRLNTPDHAFFALDPRYLDLPGLDHHGFRALAERSMLADDMKDRAVAGISPALAYVWRAQVGDRRGWSRFQPANFQRLRRKYGVDWVVLKQPQGPALTCPYVQNDVWVCRVE